MAAVDRGLPLCQAWGCTLLTPSSRRVLGAGLLPSEKQQVKHGRLAAGGWPSPVTTVIGCKADYHQRTLVIKGQEYVPFLSSLHKPGQPSVT